MSFIRFSKSALHVKVNVKHLAVPLLLLAATSSVTAFIPYHFLFDAVNTVLPFLPNPTDVLPYAFMLSVIPAISSLYMDKRKARKILWLLSIIAFAVFLVGLASSFAPNVYGKNISTYSTSYYLGTTTTATSYYTTLTTTSTQYFLDTITTSTQYLLSTQTTSTQYFLGTVTTSTRYYPATQTTTNCYLQTSTYSTSYYTALTTTSTSYYVDSTTASTEYLLGTVTTSTQYLLTTLTTSTETQTSTTTTSTEYLLGTKTTSTEYFPSTYTTTNYYLQTCTYSTSYYVDSTTANTEYLLGTVTTSTQYYLTTITEATTTATTITTTVVPPARAGYVDIIINSIEVNPNLGLPLPRARADILFFVINNFDEQKDIPVDMWVIDDSGQKVWESKETFKNIPANAVASQTFSVLIEAVGTYALQIVAYAGDRTFEAAENFIVAWLDLYLSLILFIIGVGLIVAVAILYWRGYIRIEKRRPQKSVSPEAHTL